MTGMEHAIEQVANALHGDQCAEDPDPGERCNCGADDFYRQAEIALDTLREVGLLAPAPLRKEWGSEVRDVRPDRDPYVLYAIDPDNAQWQIEHNPDYTTGRIMHRYRTDWIPVDPAEGGGSDER